MAFSPKSRLSVQEYFKGVRSNDRMILGKAITLLESQLEADITLAEELLDRVLPYSGRSLRIGITGIPGVGKSTFIEALGTHLIQNGHKLAVLTVDPSSLETHGSILGDKTRMEKLSRDDRAFIRPSPTGNHLGGVASRTREVMLLCEAAGYDYIIVETVGVGQSETYVKNMVDFFLLLMIAGAGDDLQGIKKGIMEMADAVVINKAEGDNLASARQTQSFLQQALHLFPLPKSGIAPGVHLCSSLTEEGIPEIADLISRTAVTFKESGFFDQNRNEQKKEWIHENIRSSLVRDFYQSESVRNVLSDIESDVINNKRSVLSAYHELLDIYKKK